MQKEIDFNFEDFNLKEHEILSSNMNYVARIKGVGVIKITPPGGALARFPQIKLFEDRILRDLVFNHYCKICPEILMFDLGKRYFIMEDLGKNDLRSLLRKADAVKAKKLITSLDKLLKDLESFYRKQKDLPEVFLEENPLLKEHYSHIFDYPLFNHDLIKSHWANIGLTDKELISLELDFSKIDALKINAMDLSLLKADTLIHGDLHTASIVVKGKKSFLIDGEFSHLSSKDFDLGVLYANLLIDLVLSGNDLSLLDGIKSKLSQLALQVTLFELVRQMIGASFSVPISRRESREHLIELIEELNSSLN